MSYRVELSPAAQRQARKLPPDDARRVRSALRELADKPRHAGSVKLSGFTAVWRVRVGGYRIVYDIHDDEQQLMVLRIARRSEATYRNL